MLYEMVVGRPPFSGDNPMAIAYKHVREQPVPPRQRNREIPPAFEAIVLQAMAKNPNDRDTSAEELRHDLLRFRQGRMVLANPTVMAPAVDATAVAQAYAPEATQVVQRTTALPPAAGPPPAPPQRGSGAFIALLVVMLAVLGGLLYLFGKEAGLFGQEAPERVEMPFVVGQTADQARQVLEDIGLEVQEDTVATDQQEPGKVFEQDPPAGNRVDAGAAVTIRVAAEPEKVEVPNLVGKNVDDARDLTEALGLNLVVAEKTDPNVEKDKVIAQTQEPGTEITKGSNVDVVVSAGRAQKPVPDVTGQDASDAANALGQAGFRTRTTREASSTVEDGKVIRTEPAAGSNADEGSTVTIVVSSGVEEATVPNVKGDTAEQARVKIEGAGLTYVQGPNVPSNQAEDGRVVSQSPSAGAKVERGSNVVVQLGRFTGGNGPGTSTTSTTTGS